MAVPPNMMPQPTSSVSSDPEVQATQLIALYDAIKHAIGDPSDTQNSLYAAVNAVNNHRTGTLTNSPVWDELAFQHSRIQVLLCDAVGVKPGITDYQEEARAAAQKANHLISPSATGTEGKGRFAASSIKETMSWLAFNVGTRTDIDGRGLSIMSVDPDFTGSKGLIAKELDTQAMTKIIAGLEEKQKGLNSKSAEYSNLKLTIGKLESMQKGNAFRKLVSTADDLVELADKDWKRRRDRDFGVGAWSTNRHNEEAPQTMFLLGALAAKFGVHLNTLAVITGLNTPRFEVVSQVSYDKNGKPQYRGHVTNIPLYSDRGIQRCAGMLIALFYAPQFKGEPEMVKDADGKLIMKRDPQTNRIIYKPLTPAERAELIKKPFPTFTIPSGYPNHSIQFLMDMVVQHQAMGGQGLIGFNPDALNSKNPEAVFDPDQLDAICAQMDIRTKDIFIKRLYANIDNHYLQAQVRFQNNILYPKIYEAAQVELIRERLVAKSAKSGTPLDPKSITLDMIAKELKKKPLTDEEKKVAIERHNALPNREEVQNEMVQMSYMDISGGTRGKGKTQAEINQTNDEKNAPQAEVNKNQEVIDALQVTIANTGDNDPSLKDLLKELDKAINANDVVVSVGDKNDALDAQDVVVGGDESNPPHPPISNNQMTNQDVGVRLADSPVLENNDVALGPHEEDLIGIQPYLDSKLTEPQVEKIKEVFSDLAKNNVLHKTVADLKAQNQMLVGLDENKTPITRPATPEEIKNFPTMQDKPAAQNKSAAGFRLG